jgi:hypothetical protein
MNSTFLWNELSQTVETYRYRTGSGSDRIPALNARSVVTLFCTPESVECGIRSLPLAVP